MNTRDIVRISLFSALIIIGTYIKIPMPVCPLTFQPLFVALAGMFLGGKKGAMSVGCFIFLGLIGLPVFTGGGGAAYIFRPTFGFILGYLLQAYITGIIVHSGKPELKRLLVGNFAGLIVMYAVGLGYFWAISHYYLASGLTVKGLLVNCLFLPFPKDAVMTAMAAVFGKRMLPLVDRQQRRTA